MQLPPLSNPLFKNFMTSKGVINNPPWTSWFTAVATVIGASASFANITGLPTDNTALNNEFNLCVFLAGRSGGQTIYGGQGAGENITLFSTSNSSKGNITLGTRFQESDSLGFRNSGHVIADSTGIFYTQQGLFNVVRIYGNMAPTEIYIPTQYIYATVKNGSNSVPGVGITGLTIYITDEDGVSTASNIIGLNISINPKISHSGGPNYTDMAGAVVSNASGASGYTGADAYYVSNTGPSLGWQWATSFNTDSRSQYGFRSGGVHAYGIDFSGATITTYAINLAVNQTICWGTACLSSDGTDLYWKGSKITVP